MSIISAHTPLTISEVQKREGYDDSEAVLGELQQMIDFMDEVPWFPTSHGSYNKALQAKRLGKGAFSRYNGPVPSISSQSDYITEPVKLYEGDSEVDERLLKGATDPYQVRDSEDAMNLAGFTIDWIYNFIYANEADDPDSFKSIMSRLNTIDNKNCWDNGGDGADLTSMLMFEFGRAAFHLGYPENSGPPGIQNEPRSRHKVPTPKGDGMMWAWIRHYEAWAAIILRNRLALKRIANIETAGSTNIFNPSVVIKAKAWLPRVGTNAVLFCNRTLKGQIDDNAYNKVNIAFSIQQIQNYGPITFVAGMPLRMIEVLLDTESEVT
jgi:hypothetical protein